MKSLQSYLEGIRVNPKEGWKTAYKDIMGSFLSDTPRFLNGVELFGEEIMFEALIVTSAKKLSTPDPLNYVLAVARQVWKDQLQEELTKDADQFRLERARRKISEGNAELASKIEKAKKRANADDSI